MVKFILGEKNDIYLNQNLKMKFYTKLKFLTTIIIVFIVLSCQTGEITIYNGLQKQLIDNGYVFFQGIDNVEVEKLLAKVLTADSLRSPRILKVWPEKNALLVMDQSNKEYLSIYNLSNGQLHGQFLNKGSGPNELSMPSSFEISKDDSAVEILGFNPETILRYSFDSLLQGVTKPQTKVSRFGDVMWPIWVGDSLIVALNDSPLQAENELIVTLDHQGNRVDSIGNFPTVLHKKVESVNLTSIHPSSISANDSKTIIVQNFMFSDVLHIYNFSPETNKISILNKLINEDIKEIELKGPINSDGEIIYEGIVDRKISFPFPASVGSKEFLIGKTNAKDNANFVGVDELWLVSFDGQVTAKYALDVPILSYDVDWEAGVIYGICIAHPEPEYEVSIVKFEMENYKSN